MKIIFKEFSGWTVPQLFFSFLFIFAVSVGALYLASALISLFS